MFKQFLFWFLYRLYNFNPDNNSFSLINESLDCSNCILKILKVKLCNTDFILSADTKGYVSFWDISTYINNSEPPMNLLPKYKHCLHQSGINCCDWLKLQNNYYLLTTGGDDQSLSLSVFHYKDSVTLFCNVSTVIHCSQVTGK